MIGEVDYIVVGEGGGFVEDGFGVGVVLVLVEGEFVEVLIIVGEGVGGFFDVVFGVVVFVENEEFE